LRGIRVTTAASAADALKSCRLEDFDAVVLDIVMPGMSGLEALSRLEADHPDLQVVMLTGHATVQRGVEAMKLGAMDFLEKPVQLPVLYEKIEKAVERRRELRILRSEKEIERITRSKSW
jgi:DNA-binding NtrC family response regulator